MKTSAHFAAALAAAAVSFFTVSTVSSAAASPTETPPVRLTVYNEVEQRLSPGIFGQFMERSGNEPGPESAYVDDAASGFQRPDVLAHLRQMHIPSIRFPGGAEVEFGERWTSLIDLPAADGAAPRQPTHRFGFHEFLALANTLGSDPVLVVAIGGALIENREMTPEDSVALAAGMVAYFNSPLDDPSLAEDLRRWPRLRAANGHPEPFKVKLWQLGNEPFLVFPGALRKTRNATDEQIAETYVQFLRAHLDAMRAVDPSIQVIAEAHMDEVPVLPVLMRELGGEVDYLSYHIYRPWGVKRILKDGQPFAPVADFSLADFHAAMAAVPFIDADSGLSVFTPEPLAALRATGRPLAITEWNLNHWWSAEELRSLPESFMSKGVGAAGFLHGFMRAGDLVKLAHQSMLVGSSWAIAGVRVSRSQPDFLHWRATAQVTALYARHHGDELLRVKIEDNTFYRQPFTLEGITPSGRVAHVDPLVTRRGNTLYVHAINRDLNAERTLAVDLRALTPRPAKILAHRVVGPVLDDLKSRNTAEFSRLLTETLPLPAAGAPAGPLLLALPAASVSVFEIHLHES